MLLLLLELLRRPLRWGCTGGRGALCGAGDGARTVIASRRRGHTGARQHRPLACCWGGAVPACGADAWSWVPAGAEMLVGPKGCRVVGLVIGGRGLGRGGNLVAQAARQLVHVPSPSILSGRGFGQ